MSTSYRPRVDVNDLLFAEHLAIWKCPFPIAWWHLMASHGSIGVSTSARGLLQNVLHCSRAWCPASLPSTPHRSPCCLWAVCLPSFRLLSLLSLPVFLSVPCPLACSGPVPCVPLIVCTVLPSLTPQSLSTQLHNISGVTMLESGVLSAMSASVFDVLTQIWELLTRCVEKN